VPTWSVELAERALSTSSQVRAMAAKGVKLDLRRSKSSVEVAPGAVIPATRCAGARAQPLAVPKMSLSETPPRGGRFGSPLVLSRVHWVRPDMVVEVSYVAWTPDRLLRHVVYLGEREDKLATDVRRDLPSNCPVRLRRGSRISRHAPWISN
jgi:hypothetical protein